MDVVSYRGPGAAGGVSSGLGAVWRKESENNSRWWHLNNGILEVLSRSSEQAKYIAMLPDSLVDGHYRFCNEFLWPIMHDLPQFATFSEQYFQHYKSFNRVISEQIDVETTARQDYFIQDYQLAIAPRWLNLYGHKSVIFWHIPWPKNVPAQFTGALQEIVKGMLGASAIGFHTEEYANNFRAFVNQHLPSYRTNSNSFIIENIDERTARGLRTHSSTYHTSYVLRHDTSLRNDNSTSTTRLVVHPLGIDSQFWYELREKCSSVDLPDQVGALSDKPVILSVDRVDYTKSVHDRLLIIDKFFQKHPEWIGKITFAQVCARSRKDLSAFDQYWQTCRALIAAVNNTWSQDGWQPVEWIQDPLNCQQLAYLYSHSQTMLVNPVRDGLNLTAKEYVACQGNQPGVLLLSPGAGAWHELGSYALPASPVNHEATVESLARGLNMPLKERQLRTLAMKTILASNQLADWWTEFSTIIRTPDTQMAEKENESRRPANLG